MGRCASPTFFCTLPILSPVALPHVFNRAFDLLAQALVLIAVVDALPFSDTHSMPGIRVVSFASSWLIEFAADREEW